MKRVITIGLVVTFGLSGAAWAEGLSPTAPTKSRSAIFQSQTKLLDGRLSSQYKSSGRLQPEVRRSTSLIPSFGGSYKGRYLEPAKAAARKHGIPENLFLRLVQQESAWKPNAKSHKGAIGLAQLMPATARSLGVNAKDPLQNLEGGARYLSRMYRKFGDWRLALAAYNAGPGAVEKYNGIPPYRETKTYVRKIMGS